jgi:N utilization substance protein B
MALQALYQWRLTGYPMSEIEPQLREHKDFARADAGLFERLVRGATQEAAALEGLITPCLDRAMAALSPVERSILLLGAYELAHCPETPYRVVINEAVELAKTYGGTDGHKYVNGVLDKLAPKLRGAEPRGVAADGGA